MVPKVPKMVPKHNNKSSKNDYFPLFGPPTDGASRRREGGGVPQCGGGVGVCVCVGGGGVGESRIVPRQKRSPRDPPVESRYRIDDEEPTLQILVLSETTARWIFCCAAGWQPKKNIRQTGVATLGLCLTSRPVEPGLQESGVGQPKRALGPP